MPKDDLSIDDQEHNRDKNSNNPKELLEKIKYKNEELHLYMVGGIEPENLANENYLNVVKNRYSKAPLKRIVKELI